MTLDDKGGVSNFCLHLSAAAMASGELKSKLKSQLRKSLSVTYNSLVTPAWPPSIAALTPRFRRLKT